MILQIDVDWCPQALQPSRPNRSCSSILQIWVDWAFPPSQPNRSCRRCSDCWRWWSRRGGSSSFAAAVTESSASDDDFESSLFLQESIILLPLTPPRPGLHPCLLFLEPSRLPLSLWRPRDCSPSAPGREGSAASCMITSLVVSSSCRPRGGAAAVAEPSAS